MYMPPLPLHPLAHRHVKIPRDAIDRKLSAQITPLPAPRHLLRFVLPPPLPNALFRQRLYGVLVPSLLLVGGQHVVARIATVSFLFVCAVTRAAVIGWYFLVEGLASFAILFGLGIGFGGDEGFGLGFAGEGVEALFEHFIGDFELGVAGYVDYVEVDVVAVEGGEGYVEVNSHSFAEASIHHNMLQTLAITPPPRHPFRQYQNSHYTIPHRRQLSTPFGTYGIIPFRLGEKVEFAYYSSCGSFGIFVIIIVCIIIRASVSAVVVVTVVVVASVGVTGGSVRTTTVELLLLL
mmetsp:Transcript_28225/g.60585  ORF Transcript_28225/g.60585 Transcript_28225/m.60585 type:complete len:292 (-) Transcript_28225:309-1184(-)